MARVKIIILEEAIKDQKTHLYRLDNYYFSEGGCFSGNAKGQNYNPGGSHQGSENSLVQVRRLLFFGGGCFTGNGKVYEVIV
jgi:hypothetical protein